MTDNFIEDGGFAFPSPDYNSEWRDPYANRGLSIRDWFAAHAENLSTVASAACAEALVGRPEPEDKTDYLEVVKFWAEANAIYRYIHADAMIEARQYAAK